LAAEILGQPQRDPRSAGDQPEVSRGLANRFEIMVVDRIDDRVPKSGLPQRRKGVLDGRRALLHIVLRYEPNFAAALTLQDAQEAWITHRRQRVVAHTRFRQQHVADEQIAQVNCPPVFGKSRTE